MSSQPNIRNKFYDQRSPQPPEEGVSRRHKQTHTQTDAHCNSMTESAQWADSVNINSLERRKERFKIFIVGKLLKTNCGIETINEENSRNGLKCSVRMLKGPAKART